MSEPALDLTLPRSIHQALRADGRTPDGAATRPAQQAERADLAAEPEPAASDPRRLARVEAELRQRVKEMEGLYAVSQLLADDERPVRASLRGMLSVIPAAWQFPEVTEVRLRLSKDVLTTSGFRETPWRLAAPVRSGDLELGLLEVVYTEERPPREEGPFLHEERRLLEAVAQRVAEFLLRRQAEEDRAASVAYFRALTDTATDLITLIALDGTIRYQSRSVERVMGWPAEKIVGRNLFDLVHRDDLDRVRSEVRELTRRPDPEHRVTVRCRHADGSWRVLEATGSSHLDDPAVRGIVVISRDATRRLADEAALRASEERFSRLFQASPLAISVTRLEDDVLVEVNQAFLDRVGLSREEVLGRSILDLPLGITDGTRLRLQSELRENGRVRDLEVQLQPPGGVPQVHMLSAEIIELGGEPCSLVVGQDVTARKKAEVELRHRAFFDDLTGLPNRAHFEERLGRALERAADRGEDLAVFFLDLDRFKVINDSLGHAVGDSLLREVARRLTDARRPTDLLARFGGDEFGGLVDPADGPEGAGAVVEELLRTLEEPMTIQGHRVHVRASAGIAYCGGACDSAQDLLRYADIAMYRAKRKLGGGWEMYDVERDASESNRYHLESELRTALERDELRLFVQPVVSLERHARTCGVEALVRWQHPEHGLLAPAEFLEVAEDSGLVAPMGAWVLREACRRLAGWRRDGVVDGDFWISVNVSPQQLKEGGLVDALRRVLAETGLPPRCLLLEVTESTLVQAQGAAVQLASLGVRLALDDFGTGYASLGYLKQLPVDVLKIDRSFTRDVTMDPADATMIRTILFMSRHLGMEAVVEGVETGDQLALLREMDCAYAQGFFFGRPMPAGEADRWLSRPRR